MNEREVIHHWLEGEIKDRVFEFCVWSKRELTKEGTREWMKK